MNVFYNHLHFRSADPDGAARFYCDNFGAEIVGERPLSNTKSIELSLNGTYLMTISGRAQGEDPVAGSTEPALWAGPPRLPDRRHHDAGRHVEVQQCPLQLRAVGDALRFRRGLHRRPRRGQRGDHPAARRRRGARRLGVTPDFHHRGHREHGDLSHSPEISVPSAFSVVN